MARVASGAPARWRSHRRGPTWRLARAPPASIRPRPFAAEFGKWGAGREAYSFDVAIRSDLETTCARVKSDFEPVDILVNNAGVTRDRSFRKMDRNEWDEVINVNLSCVFDVTRLFIDAMVRVVGGGSSTSRASSVVSVTSDSRTTPLRRPGSSA